MSSARHVFAQHENGKMTFKSNLGAPHCALSSRHNQPGLARRGQVDEEGGDEKGKEAGEKKRKEEEKHVLGRGQLVNNWEIRGVDTQNSTLAQYCRKLPASAGPVPCV